ncbi:MAG TPA: isoprenylcysteine carboxylmethyltransferase family protein [Thermoanaerobaculia bacterium]|nr:isoprenylcysteine carboxylmethyltransferase family protein [Thermoanaerobaculia bacterium]
MSWSHGVSLARYAMGVLLAVAVPPALLYWFIVHPFIGFWRRVGARRTFWFLGVFYAVTIAALFPVRDRLLGRDLGTNPLAISLAVPLVVASAWVSRRRRRQLKFAMLAGLPELSPEQHGVGLLTEGIYGRIRHPRYVEFVLGSLGWALFANYGGLYVLLALSCAVLFLVVLLEERELRARFGQAYVDYSLSVPRFVPRRR